MILMETVKAITADQQPEHNEGIVSSSGIDLEKLARKLYEKLLEKLEIENERTGHG